ncbi:hypothetical protein Tco_1159131 [Tanacetum coccineum]
MSSSFGIICILCNDEIRHDLKTILQHVATFHPHALLDVAAVAPPPAIDHDVAVDLLFECIFFQWCDESFPDLSSSTVHIFNAHVAPVDDVAGDNSVCCGSCFSCFF